MDRYFIWNYSNLSDVQKLIKNGEIKSKVIDLIVHKSTEQKSITWWLLKEDISFERSSMGSSIARFTIDLTMPYFVKAKKEK